MTTSTLSPDLRTRLETAGVSQMELSRRLGVAGRTVRYWIANGTPERMWPEIEEALKPRPACPHCGQPMPRDSTLPNPVVSRGNEDTDETEEETT